MPDIHSADSNHYLLVPKLTEQGLLLSNGTMAVLKLPLSNELRMDLSFTSEVPRQPVSVFLKNNYGAGYLLELWADQQTFHRLSRIEQSGKKHLLHAVPCFTAEEQEEQKWELCWAIQNENHRISLNNRYTQADIFNWEDFSSCLSSPLHALEFKADGNSNVLLTA